MDTALSIPWLERVDDALARAQATGKLAFLAFSQAPRCAGSVALERDVFPHERVAALILEHCVPARMIRSEAQGDAARYGVVWTPTFVIAEADGRERHRLVGFLPLEDFLAHLELGLAKVTFGRDGFVAAERAFAAVAREHPGAHAAPEAEYWAGVSRYKQDKDRQFLHAVAERLRDRYPSSEWTARASVWL
jgi:Thioredoxin-like domain